MELTTRQKIAHLFRRFGFGATIAELDALEMAGLDATISYLVNYESIDEGFPISPWEFFFDQDNTFAVDPPRISRWWALRMLITKRPLQEKLTLFWHNHFAVSGEKIENGIFMLIYLETIRKHAAGNFHDLLTAMTVDPAMLQWLDNDQNVIGNPNENFGRELLELFTLGIGHYTESDVKECARAVTGWSLRSVIPQGGPETAKERLSVAFEKGIPLVASAFSPIYHDQGQKTILGKTANFDTQSILNLLADHPQTHRFICKKLWEFFAYEEPENAIIERLASVFKNTNGNIKSVMQAIAASPEFWSEKCVNQLVKSPADFTIGIINKLQLTDAILKDRAKDTKWFTPITPTPNLISSVLQGAMYQQGMLLLFPPDVSGWRWGKAWVSPAMMLERSKFATLLLGPERDPAVGGIIFAYSQQAGVKSDEGLVDFLTKMFDVQINDGQKQILLTALSSAGGFSKIKDARTASDTLAPVVKLLFSTPTFNMN
ncbi:MAG: DUF1800 family protein [Fimbriimonadaceae bacterium]